MATPSFNGLSPASASNSRAKQQNGATGTLCERTLQPLLWRRGLRFRHNLKSLPGKPDTVFPTVRVTVFCDGDSWTGRKWRTLAKKLRAGANGFYWLSKIQSNCARHRRADRLLSEAGWTVVSVWESEIAFDADRVARNIEALVRKGQGTR